MGFLVLRRFQIICSSMKTHTSVVIFPTTTVEILYEMVFKMQFSGKKYCKLALWMIHMNSVSSQSMFAQITSTKTFRPHFQPGNLRLGSESQTRFFLILAPSPIIKDLQTNCWPHLQLYVHQIMSSVILVQFSTFLWDCTNVYKHNLRSMELVAQKILQAELC